ncbi:MAG: hypothetical protein GYB64_14615 [Chloroflexi bacterium]|nr:hypothetical protein [Chloroflexota bacterium]
MVEGQLLVAHGDGFDGEYLREFTLMLDDGTVVDLDIDGEVYDAAGGDLIVANQRVEVTIEDGQATRLAYAGPGEAGTDAVIGPQPWLTIKCEFPGGSNETAPESYFQNMYSNTYPGLGHYWQRQSFSQVNINGSNNYNGWHTLPNPSGYYWENGYKLNELAGDCLAASNANVSGYIGVNFMFDETFGCCAWGGGSSAVPVQRVTWNPPWAWQDITVIAHEMGHGFGLPHSNNYDMDGDPYDNPYDVMSGAFLYNIVDPTYGQLGKHTISYHKDALLGWIPDDNRFEVPAFGDTYRLTIENIARQSTDEYYLATIDLGSSYGYTVEARHSEDYDLTIPGEAILIHETYPFRTEDAWLAGCTSGADTPCSGGQWTVGETFTDAANDIRVRVEEKTTHGFVVSISNDGAIKPLANGSFEADPNSDDIPDGWNFNGGDGFQLCNAQYADTGSCLFVFKGTGGTDALIQTLDVSGSSGTSFDLSFKYRGTDITGNPFVGMRIEFSGPGGSQSVNCLANAPTVGFQTKTCTVTANQNFNQIRLYGGWRGATGGFLAFDSITLTP